MQKALLYITVKTNNNLFKVTIYLDLVKLVIV